MNLLILVVDDEPDVEVLFRQQFRHDLRAGRFTMEFTQSAPAALQCIRDAASASLILILSDINMPGMSGLALLGHLCQQGCKAPVIVVTASREARLSERVAELGACAFLTKPVPTAALLAAISMAQAWRSQSPHT